jgi:hypothetical protein
MNNVKYIKTQRNEIIVFSENITHSEFKHFSPKSAGFICFGISETGGLSCTCYGRSDSLGMSSDPNDNKLAMIQILGSEPWDI